jgi:hypothetical protein
MWHKSYNNKTNTGRYEIVVINLLPADDIPNSLEQLVPSLLATSALFQDDDNLFPRTCQQQLVTDV